MVLTDVSTPWQIRHQGMGDDTVLGSLHVTPHVTPQSRLGYATVEISGEIKDNLFNNRVPGASTIFPLLKKQNWIWTHPECKCVHTLQSMFFTSFT